MKSWNVEQQLREGMDKKRDFKILKVVRMALVGKRFTADILSMSLCVVKSRRHYLSVGESWPTLTD